MESGECRVSASVNSSHFPFCRLRSGPAGVALACPPVGKRIRLDHMHRILAGDHTRSIGRVVVDDDHFVVEVHLINQRAQALVKVGFFVSRRDNDRHFDSVFGGIHLCEALQYYRFVKRFASVTALVWVFVLAACNGNRPPKIGEKAPDFTLTDSDRTVQLSQLKGKPVLLNFWATWCPPCIEEMPSLVELQKKVGDKVTILAVSEDADDKAYKQFIRDHNIDLLTVQRRQEHGQRASMGPSSFLRPTSSTRTEVIRRKFIGPADWTNAEIVDYLNKM